MGSVMVSHVNELLGLGRAAESGFAYGGRFSHESDDSAVGGYARIDVQYFDALD